MGSEISTAADGLKGLGFSGPRGAKRMGNLPVQYC